MVILSDNLSAVATQSGSYQSRAAVWMGCLSVTISDTLSVKTKLTEKRE